VFANLTRPSGAPLRAGSSDRPAGAPLFRFGVRCPRNLALGSGTSGRARRPFIAGLLWGFAVSGVQFSLNAGSLLKAHAGA